MFVIVEEGNDITVGTAFHEPNDFLYLIFVMGICNIDDSQEMLESRVDEDSIKRVMKTDTEDIGSRLESIIKRSENNVSLYEWSTYVTDEENKKVVKQIITDIEYHDGVVTIRFNYSLRDALVQLKKYYSERIEDIVKLLKEL